MCRSNTGLEERESVGFTKRATSRGDWRAASVTATYHAEHQPRVQQDERDTANGAGWFAAAEAWSLSLLSVERS